VTLPDEATEPLVVAVVESILDGSGRWCGDYHIAVDVSVTPEGTAYTWAWFSRKNEHTYEKGPQQ
jgi:tartrate dehydratase alpha subunit/fumarate hydratase class I-like protein